MFEAVIIGRSHPRLSSLVQPPGDPPLASFDLLSYLGIHSKTSVPWVKGLLLIPLNTPENAEGFRVFSSNDPSEPFGVRLAKA